MALAVQSSGSVRVRDRQLARAEALYNTTTGGGHAGAQRRLGETYENSEFSQSGDRSRGGAHMVPEGGGGWRKLRAAYSLYPSSPPKKREGKSGCLLAPRARGASKTTQLELGFQYALCWGPKWWC